MPHSTSNLGVLHSGNKIHKPELVKKIGGTDVLKQAVNNFYDRLTVDPAIRVFFEGADLQVLRWHQFNRKLLEIAYSKGKSNAAEYCMLRRDKNALLPPRHSLYPTFISNTPTRIQSSLSILQYFHTVMSIATFET